jgi:alpha-D-xyloside xylohydrolase
MVTDFRRAVEMKYALMPYIMAEATESSARGWPMLRSLFFEHPDDPTSWLIEDEYMFGSRLLVAPLMDSLTTRKVYLPPGTWIDYQTRTVYEGARWHDITAGAVPVVVLVKNHTVLPHLAVAQSTSTMNWSDVELRLYSSGAGPSEGRFIAPGGSMQTLRVEGGRLASDPSGGRVKWRVTR